MTDGGLVVDSMIALYAVAGILGVLLVFGLLRARRRNQKPSQHGNDEDLLDSILEQQSPGSADQRRGAASPAPPSLPGTNTTSASGLAALEGHLRIAILDANARERLVAHAMKETGVDRAAAVRKVLRDIDDEYKKYG